MTPPQVALSEVGRLTRVVVKHARDAFGGQSRIASEWRPLNFTAEPDFAAAVREYDQFLDLLTTSGAAIDVLPADDSVGLDSIYARDASVVTPGGVVLCRMGKAARAGEPAAQGRALLEWERTVLGAVREPGRLEGGDVVWLNDRTVAVGRGYRTNAEGIAQFRRYLGDGVECLEVPLPHWRGPQDVFHLMSILSPVAPDLAVVYAPLLPVPFRERLVDLGYGFVDVPDAEFDSMGANVLALAPRRCVVVAGNPETRRRLEHAGAEVLAYAGHEISIKGGGGPTCLTRPLERDPV